MSAIPDHPDHPHVAIVTVDVKVFEKLPSGEASGRPLSSRTMKFAIERKDRQNCLDAEAKIMEGIKNLCL